MVIRLIFCTALAVTSVDAMPVDAEALEWISRQRLEVDPSLTRIAEDMADASAEPLLQGWAERSRPVSVGTRVTRIFVSRAMPRDDLIAALTAAQEDRDTIVVFRGLPAGTGLAFFRQELVGWLGPFAHWSSPPQIQLDPQRFVTRASRPLRPSRSMRVQRCSRLRPG
ncbi:MAG: hypothetical protein IPK97_05170 [Ahniella sp.]|nr:hypothetical protein [Ahniella sp.]